MTKLRIGVRGDPVVIRRCHQNRCNWDDPDAPMFLSFDWKGERTWKIRLLCQRGCGSLKEMTFRPGLPLEEYLSRRNIERPENWYDVGPHFTAALSERVELGEVLLEDEKGERVPLAKALGGGR